MANRIVELSYTAFVNAVLPGKNLNRKQVSEVKDFSRLAAVVEGTGSRSATPEKIENDMYPVLIETLNSITSLSKCASGCEFRDVSQWRESDQKDFRPDLVLYPTTEVAIKAFTHNMKKKNVKEFKARCAWAHMISLIEVKPNDTEAAFTFAPWQTKDKGLFNPTKKGNEARAAFAKYAAEVMLRQHRTHLFTFYISGCYARAFYWDRNGALCTKSIDLRTHALQFQNLVFRVASLNDVQQGFDPTVTSADDNDLIKLLAYKSDNPWLMEYHAHMTKNAFDYPIYKVQCPAVVDSNAETKGKRKTRAATTKAVKTFLIGRPVHGYVCPTGRCTRGYVAFDLDAEDLVFLKDQWRDNAPNTRTELETYERLKRHDVSYIATVIAGGDVVEIAKGGVQRTRTQDFKFPGVEKGRQPHERIHIRLVTKEVGRSLDTYADQVELLDVCSMAFIAHMQAWEKGGVLHRDISNNNILIDARTGCGFLSDWDLCKWQEDLLNKKAASQPAGVSGTWPFMSAVSLQHPTKPSEVADDLEAFIHVILYLAARFHLHEKSPPRVGRESDDDDVKAANARNSKLELFLQTFFYAEHECATGHFTGGDEKLKQINVGTPPIRLEESELLNMFLENAFTLLHEHYKRINWEDLKPYAAAPAHQGRVPTNSAPRETRRPHNFAVLAFANTIKLPDRKKSPPAPRRSHTPLLSANSRSTPLSSGSSSGVQSKKLDNHAELLRLFVECLGQEDMDKYMDDKFIDQFDNLKHLVPTSTKNASGSGKRKSDSKSDGEPPEKKIRGPGYKVVTKSRLADSALTVNTNPADDNDDDDDDE